MSLTTKWYTWTQMWAEIKSEFDIDDDDDFVDETEAMGYANAGIDRAETIINSKHEEYFLSVADIALVSGQDYSTIPTTMWGFKIRSLIYNNTTTGQYYEIERIPTLAKFLEYARARQGSASSTDRLRYFPLNTTAAAPIIKWSPAPQETSSANVQCFFYRQANRLTTGSDSCDIPEFASFVMDWIRERIEYKRAAGSPRHQTAVSRLKETEAAMMTSLSDMVIDGQNEIEQDISHYEEHN